MFQQLLIGPARSGHLALDRLLTMSSTLNACAPLPPPKMHRSHVSISTGSPCGRAYRAMCLPWYSVPLRPWRASRSGRGSLPPSQRVGGHYLQPGDSRHGHLGQHVPITSWTSAVEQLTATTHSRNQPGAASPRRMLATRVILPKSRECLTGSKGKSL